MKLFYRLLIALCLFFISGYSFVQSLAGPKEVPVHRSSVPLKIAVNAQHTRFDDLPNSPSRASRPVPSLAKKDKMNVPDDEDDDEPVSFKKWQQPINYFPSIFYFHACSYYPCYAPKRAPSENQYCYASCSRHIRFRVIRI